MKKVVVILSLCAVIFSANSQSDPNSAKLSFEQAVKIGLENNVTLNQQKNQLMFTQVNKTSSLLQMAPSVQLTGNAGRFDGNSFNQQRGEVVNGQLDFLNASLGASIPVFNGFNQMNIFRQADKQNEAQLSFVARTQQDVIRNIAAQFLTCLLDQQLNKIDLQNLETQKAQFEQIKAQVEGGGRAEADLYNQEYLVKNAELLALRSANRLKNDKAILAQTLLMDPISSFELEEANWDIIGLSEEVPLDQLNSEALQFRNDLRQASLTEQAAGFGLSATRGRFYPNLSAFGQINSRYNYIYGAPDNRSFDQQFSSDNRQVSYGLSLTVPIFNGFLTRSQVSQSKVTFENARINTKGVETRVKTEVLLAYQNFKDAQLSYASSEAQLKSAELAYRVEKERYDLGVTNIVQLTTSQQSYVRAQSDYVSARYTLMFQKILMSYATGTLKVEDLPK